MTGHKPELATALASQAEALTLYLEALFTEQPVSLPVPVAAPVIDVPVARVIEVPVMRVEPVVEVVTPAPVVTAAPPAPAVAAATETEAAAAVADARPDWAQTPFPVLLLKVEGMAFALPLVKLNRILPWAEPTTIPGYADWLLGVLRLDGLTRNLKVVDTAAFVMPERAIPAADPASPAGGPRHIVMVGEGEWGLTCEDVSSIVTIDPEKVRWRTSRGKRPWLAGTVIEQLCALLDAERLADMLSAAAPGLPS